MNHSIDRYAEFEVPIYLSKVGIIVTSNLQKAYDKRWVDVFGEYDFTGTAAITSRNEYNQFALFFGRGYLSHTIIAHELTHLTARICESAGVEPGSNHEPQAYLCGYLADKVYKQLNKWKETIR